MRVLVISQAYYPEPFRIHEICEGLVKRGHVVTVLTGLPNYPEGEIYSNYKNCYYEEMINGVNVIRVKNRPRKKGNINLLRNYLSFWMKAKKRVKKLKDFDLVYVYELSPIHYLDAGRIYAKKHNVPLICYVLDLWPESLCARGIKKGSLIYNHYLKVSKKLYNSCDELIVTSPSFKKYLVDVIDYKKDITYLPQHYSITRETSIMKHEGINIVYAGNIGFAQNISLLISVAKRIDNVNFHIYGSGSEYEKCFNEAKGSKNVIMHGRVEKEKIDFGVADACYLSLSGDSFLTKTIPGKVQEYMAMGKPILASINDDAKSIVLEANCGLVCRPDDDEALYEMIRDFVNNMDKYARFSENAKKYYFEHFTLEKHIEELEKILKQVK